ncbi:hypothetical protein M407DRAFT_29975 [Tulasnella calospora MUT 4182]|uniref:Protein kinase domain-containing protein n=1 Tax=Tulasnella calospora MUT 4182 TaxID=1051891 RepID=A0A0C3KFZ6_9AGAM|nr:hypothetical protein M407DRAFT_29975 [Tulasnella calospora MUT 4182]
MLGDGVQGLPSDMWALGWICWEIMTGKFPFEELVTEPPIICRVVQGELPAIQDDGQLSQIKELCSVMSDCWISNPVKRINAPTFRRKISLMPSTAPSSSTAGDAKVRSAALLQELGTMYHHQGNVGMAEEHY